jgi:site-specific recombinase XerD
MPISNEFYNYLKRRGYSRSSLQTYSISLDHFFDFLKKDQIKISHITNRVLQKYKNKLVKESSPKSVNIRLAAMKKFVEFLNEEKGYNIEYKNIGATKTNRKKDIKQVNGIERIMSSIENQNRDKKRKERDKLIFKLLYYTGGKTKEIIHIKKHNINKKGVIINKRQVILPTPLLQTIKKYSDIIDAGENDYIFYSFSPAFKYRQKSPLTEKAVEELFNKYKDDKNLTIRDIRHSYILDLQKNVPDIHSPSSLWEEKNLNQDYLNYNNHNIV